MLIPKIIAFIFIVFGFGMVFGAKNVVKRFNLDKAAKCDFEHEMKDEELQQYKFMRATVNVKMMGMLVALPGLILLVIVFK